MGRYVPEVIPSDLNDPEVLTKFLYDEFRRISNIQQPISKCSAAINADAPDADFGAGFSRLDFYDIFRIPTVNMIMGLDGVFSFLNIGDYVASITGLFFHNSIGTDRIINFRLLNIDTTVVSDVYKIDTEKNSRGTNTSITTLFDINRNEIGDNFVVEIGGGDTYTNVVWQALNFSIWEIDTQ